MAITFRDDIVLSSGIANSPYFGPPNKIDTYPVPDTDDIEGVWWVPLDNVKALECFAHIEVNPPQNSADKNFYVLVQGTDLHGPLRIRVYKWTAPPQTVSLTLNAAAQNQPVSENGETVTINVSVASVPVTLSAGVPQTVSLGDIDLSPTNLTPNGPPVNFDPTLNRSLTVTGAGLPYPFDFTEQMQVSGSGDRAGGSGQYFQADISLAGGTQDYSLGSVGTLQVQLLAANGSTNGLGPPTNYPVPISAVLTFIPA